MSSYSTFQGPMKIQVSQSQTDFWNFPILKVSNSSSTRSTRLNINGTNLSGIQLRRSNGSLAGGIYSEYDGDKSTINIYNSPSSSETDAYKATLTSDSLGSYLSAGEYDAFDTQAQGGYYFNASESKPKDQGWRIALCGGFNLGFYRGTREGSVQNLKSVVYGDGGAGSFSDMRFKKDIERIEPSTSNTMITTISPKSYTLNDDQMKERKVGVIAQEVDSILPNCIMHPSNKNPYYMVDYNVLFCHNMNTVKHNSSCIDSISSKLKQLEERIQLLSST